MSTITANCSLTAAEKFSRMRIVGVSLQRPKERTVAQKYNGGNKMVLANYCEDCLDKYRDRSEVL